METLQRRNTDWFDLLFRSDVTHTHALNVSGGTEAVKYYVSAGYSNIEGAARGSDSEKFSALAKVDVEYMNTWVLRPRLIMPRLLTRGILPW